MRSLSKKIEKMKKLILSLTGMGIAIALVFASCQKEEITKQSDRQDKQIVNHNDNTAKVGGHNMRYYYDNGGNDYGCEGSSGNCYETVDVTPKLADVINDIGDNNDDDGKVKELVKVNYEPLTDILSDQILDGIIEGQFNLRVKGSLHSEGKTAYLLILKGEDIASVYPASI